MTRNAADLAAGFDQRYREIIHAGDPQSFNYFRGIAPVSDIDAVCAVAGEWIRLKDVMKLAGFTKRRTVLALDSAVRAGRLKHRYFSTDASHQIGHWIRTAQLAAQDGSGRIAGGKTVKGCGERATDAERGK